MHVFGALIPQLLLLFLVFLAEVEHHGVSTDALDQALFLLLDDLLALWRHLLLLRGLEGTFVVYELWLFGYC